MRKLADIHGTDGGSVTVALPEEASPQLTYVYMFYSAGKVKIGTTTDPVRRLDMLQNSSSAGLHLVWIGFGDRREEDRLHVRFAADRMHGEWFRLSDDIREFIAEHTNEKAPFAGMLRGAELSWNRSQGQPK